MNTFNKKIINDGSKYIVLAVYIKSDGASGDFDGEVLIDPVDFGLKEGYRLRLQEVDYSFSGFDAVLEFETGESWTNLKWVLSESSNMAVDFQKWGNLIDDSPFTGSGKLLISTTGLTSSTDQGSLFLRVSK